MFPAWWLLGHRNNEPPIEGPSATNLVKEWVMEVDWVKHHSWQ